MVITSGGLTLKELLEAMRDVTVQWFDLGIYLGLPPEVLETIRADWSKVEECKIEMLIKWSEQDTPTWEKLVKGLMELKMYSSAAEIATEHRELSVTS